MSSRSQPRCCCCYRKGTNFQANHNNLKDMRVLLLLLLLPQRYKFSSKSQPILQNIHLCKSCCCYRKGTNFQANHNSELGMYIPAVVVVATAKVQIFKQITTLTPFLRMVSMLLLLPQRYKFSSKSQLMSVGSAICGSCCCYRKGTNFQANHNQTALTYCQAQVVVATAKVQIFKQITTPQHFAKLSIKLLLLPQRYKFSSKSQRHPTS